MDHFSELNGVVPKYMLESVNIAYERIFGRELQEAALLENQREIDRLTRDNIYKGMAANYMGGYPNDWNDPRAQSMFTRMHDTFNRMAHEMYGEIRGRAAQYGYDMPENEEGMFRNRRGNELTVLQVTMNGIREALLNFQGANPKFMPGLARIAILFPRMGGCGFNSQFQDSRRLKLLRAFAQYVSELADGDPSQDPEAPGAEFNTDLNGLDLDDIMSRYGNAVREILQDNHDRVHNYTPDGAGAGNYRIVRIDSFEQAREYARYARWCICEGRMFWDTYALNGANTVYFCLRDGFENEPRVPGENTPLDSYGTSMMCIIVDDEGDLATSTTRWNDENEGTDWAITPEQVCNLVGRRFADAFPAHPNLPNFMRRHNTIG